MYYIITLYIFYLKHWTDHIKLIIFKFNIIILKTQTILRGVFKVNKSEVNLFPQKTKTKMCIYSRRCIKTNLSAMLTETGD